MENPPALAIETGTHTGVTTHFLAQVLECPIISIEAHERYIRFASLRLRDFEHVRLLKGDSELILAERLMSWKHEFQLSGSNWMFCYLDAHWQGHLPLRGEMAAIVSSQAPAVVVIDDFKVPSEPSFGYDTYEQSGPLQFSLIEDLLPATWSIWYPAYSAMQETGTRRGWILCASPEAEGFIEGLTGVSRGEPSVPGRQ